MNKLLERLKSAFQAQDLQPHQTLTRSQARKAILARINTPLSQEGFIHVKGNQIWRINDNKTDVIEIRFLTAEERQQFNLPESTFSLLYGCYFYFIPDIFCGRFLHQISDIITPRETYCHYRESVNRTIEQLPKKMDKAAWHLDESEEKQKIILDDLESKIINEVFTTLNKFKDIQEWIKTLESTESNLGVGNPNSLNRHFLLGFTYKHINDKSQAKKNLARAKELFEQINIKSAATSTNIKPDSPIFMQQQLIEHALKELDSLFI